MKHLIYVFMIILLVSSVSAIMIEPPELTFEKVLDYAEKTIIISSEKQLDITLSATSPFEDWIIFSPVQAGINKNGPVEFRVIVQLPEGTSLGTYQGFIVINTIAEGNELTASISTALDIKTTIEVTDEEILQANVHKVIVDNIEFNNPLKTSVSVQNQGNIAVSSFFKIDILNASKNNIMSIQSEKVSILPLSTEILELEIPNDFPIGKYYADIVIYANDMILRKHQLSFNIVEQGALPIEKKSAIIIHPEPIPLSTGPFTILVLIFVVLYVTYKIAKVKSKKKKKKSKK